MGIRRFFGKLFGRKTKTTVTSTSRKAIHAVRKPTVKKPKRSTAGAFFPDTMKKFLDGEKVVIYLSDWVRSAEWDEMAGILTVMLKQKGKPDHKHTYPCSKTDAMAFGRAISKGGFLHDFYISKGISGQPGLTSEDVSRAKSKKRAEEIHKNIKKKLDAKARKEQQKKQRGY